MQMLDEAVAASEGEGVADEDWEPVRLDVNVDAYVPADYIPYEQAKVDVHRRIAGAREVADLVLLREELEDRFGELPEPLDNLISLQQARIKLGQAGARAVTFRGDRLAVTPIELDSVRAKQIRAEIPEALYESGKSQLSVRVPKDPGAAVPGGRAGGRRAAGGDARGRRRGVRGGRGRLGAGADARRRAGRCDRLGSHAHDGRAVGGASARRRRPRRARRAGRAPSLTAEARPSAPDGALWRLAGRRSSARCGEEVRTPASVGLPITRRAVWRCRTAARSTDRARPR